MTILNSNFEEWSAKNPEKDFTQFPFSVSKMGKSGALFDLDKLNDVSRDELSKLSPEDMYEFLNGWVNEFGTDADRAHFKDRDYVIKILALIMGAGQKKRRKDIERAGQGVRLFDYFFDDTFAPEYSFRFDNDTVNCCSPRLQKITTSTTTTPHGLPNSKRRRLRRVLRPKTPNIRPTPKSIRATSPTRPR